MLFRFLYYYVYKNYYIYDISTRTITFRKSVCNSSKNNTHKERYGFFNDVYEVVKSIPYGRVLSYGQVAALSGHRGCARQVGYALHSNPDPENIPCFRVVFKDGSLASGFAFGGKDEQRRLLEAEGVEFYGEKVKKEYFC